MWYCVSKCSQLLRCKSKISLISNFISFLSKWKQGIFKHDIGLSKYRFSRTPEDKSISLKFGYLKVNISKRTCTFLSDCNIYLHVVQILRGTNIIYLLPKCVWHTTLDLLIFVVVGQDSNVLISIWSKRHLTQVRVYFVKMHYS